MIKKIGKITTANVDQFVPIGPYAPKKSANFRDNNKKYFPFDTERFLQARDKKLLRN